MSSIPNAAMPHATTVPSPVVSGSAPSAGIGERIAARARTIPVGAWAAGAATLGFAAAAATVATLRGRTTPAKPAPRRRRTAKVRRRVA